MRAHDDPTRSRTRLLTVLAALILITAACTATKENAATATLKDFTITIGGSPIAAGKPTTFNVSNVGQSLHSLAIKVAGLTHETPHLPPGGKATLEVPALTAGTYTLWCTVPGHRESGMETKLTVRGRTGASGAPAPNQLTPDEIDGDHEAVLKAFPAKTEGLGGQVLEPTIVGGVKVFDLTAQAVTWEVSPGQMVEAFAYNGQIPGPEIRVRKGDRIKVVVHNELPESTSVHFHGVTVPNAMDGVAFITQPPIKPGGSFTYAFPVVNEPGTHMYHSHHNSTIQVGKGLLGAFIVEPTSTPAWDIERTMVLGDGPLGFTINGKGFPATAPIAVKKGQRVLVRYMNEGQIIHPMHLHGFPSTVIARDGRETTRFMVDTLSIAPGERFDIVFTASLPGTWAFHCHILSHAESEHGFHGMTTVVIVT